MQQVDPLAEAIAWLEKANADLEPELMNAEFARDRLAMYSRAEKLAAFGRTSMTRKVDDAQVVARTTGISMGQAKATVETAKALRESESVALAFGGGDISFEQASVIAKADVAKPGAADELLRVAREASFSVLKEESRKVVLEAEQHKGLGERQREARAARTHVDDLGMTNINLRLTRRSAARSSTAPRTRPAGSSGRLGARAAPSPTSATSPMPSRRCCREPARGHAPRGPSS